MSLAAFPSLAMSVERDAPQPLAKRRERGSTQVYADLREDILSLRILPGTPLDEAVLGARFGLSRTPIREALLILAGEELVTFLPSGSAMAAPHTMANTPEYLDALILHARAMARLAANNRGGGEGDALLACQAAFLDAVAGADIARIVAADLAFHNAIGRASRNQFLDKCHRLSLDCGRRMMLLHYYPLFDAAERENCVRDHAGMIEAIVAGEGARAEDLASRHVLAALKIIQQSLEPRLDPAYGLGLGMVLENR